MAELEWLETDGLGGFASGTVSLVRTRRYHALLLRADGSPCRRFVLVNGLEAVLHTPEGSFALNSQRYSPGVLVPAGSCQVGSFTAEPWPAWTFDLPGGRTLRQEIFIPRGQSAAVLTWRLTGSTAGCSLVARPFLSGRDPHSLQHENPAFAFAPVSAGAALVWNPYPGVPPVAIASSGAFSPAPDWYRRFLYAEEQARGLDAEEDLAAPGVWTMDFATGAAVLILASPDGEAGWNEIRNTPAGELAAGWRESERKRRDSSPGPLHRAAEAYLVKRGHGLTIIAGYPWFTDWGRDTFISLRGLCLATGWREAACSILVEWAAHVSAGMLPNFFPDGSAPPEFNSVDASLWYIVAVQALLQSGPVPAAVSAPLHSAVNAILAGYARGTRFGIRADEDGLLYAGQTGVQLTWMDAKVGDWVVTPRIGKPVEVQALWINALRFGAKSNPVWGYLADRALASFRAKFWHAEQECLYDVIDVDFHPGAVDRSIRPNQIFALGGLPEPLLTGRQAAGVLRIVEENLLTPIGLRTLSPDHPDYRPHYGGGVLARDGAYHQGTVWPWLMGPFVEGWLRVHGGTPEAKATARQRFLVPLAAHLQDAGLGHLCEIADGAAPHQPCGCPFQAWSLAEYIRLELQVLRP